RYAGTAHRKRRVDSSPTNGCDKRKGAEVIPKFCINKGDFPRFLSSGQGRTIDWREMADRFQRLLTTSFQIKTLQAIGIGLVVAFSLLASKYIVCPER